MIKDFEQFEKKYLVENFTNNKGKPKHTRFVKHHFLRFARELLDKYGLDLYTCSDCGVGSEWNGKELKIQLDHINGITNDSRPENLRGLCPNCHSQTPNYCRPRRFLNESK